MRRRFPSTTMTMIRALSVLVTLISSSFATADDEPRIPGAVTVPPAWLADAPFDIKTFYAMPPAAENAAPLYLEAFAEFTTEALECLPPGRRPDARVIADRAKRHGAIYTDFSQHPDSYDRKNADAMIAELKEGFRKLDLAQQRPKCAFAIGIGFDAMLPHAQAARVPTRALQIKAKRELERGEIDLAVKDFGTMLRLSRDLRPCGPAICQLISIAVDGVGLRMVLPTILAAPSLKATHCDRLLAILDEHESKGLDTFSTSVQGGYILQRSLLRALRDRMGGKGGNDGRFVDEKLDRKAAATLLATILDQIDGNPGKKAGDPRVVERCALLLDALPPDGPNERAAVDDCARSLLAIRSAAYPDRILKIESLKAKYLQDRGDGKLDLIRLTAVSYESTAQASARDLAEIRAARCLVALRRRKLARPSAAYDLAAACEEAKLPGIPIDPFSAKPLGMAIVDGQPIVYSIGPDNRDDGGLKDWDFGRKPDGDILFPLPKLAAKRR